MSNLPSFPTLALILACGAAAVVPTMAQVAPRPMAPPASTVPATGVEVPIVALIPNPVVEVRVNGRGPFRFLVDTAGAGHARADVSLVAALGLPVVGQVQGGDGTGQGTRAMDLVRFDSLVIGGAEFRQVDAPSRDYNVGRAEKVDGVLGVGLFADYLLTIDLPGRRLRLAPGSLPAPDGRRVLPVDMARGVPSVPLRVAGREVAADLDTSSMGAILLPRAIAKDLPLAGEPIAIGRARTVTNDVTIYEAPLRGAASLGDLEFPEPTLQFADIFRTANIGMRVLGDLVVTLDQRHGRIGFVRVSTSPASGSGAAVAPPRRLGAAFVPTEAGLRVDQVMADLPAARAGLRPGDVLIEVDGRPIVEIPETERGRALTGPDRVVLTVRRGADLLKLEVRYVTA